LKFSKQKLTFKFFVFNFVILKFLENFEILKERKIMKILKKEWFIWKFWKKGSSREKGEGGNEIHATCACAINNHNALSCKINEWNYVARECTSYIMNNTCILCPQFFDWYSIREKVSNSIFLFRAISLTSVGKPPCFFKNFSERNSNWEIDMIEWLELKSKFQWKMQVIHSYKTQGYRSCTSV
jgi:hypothetical protein